MTGFTFQPPSQAATDARAAALIAALVTSGSGAPDALAGTLGQWYIRTGTPGVASQNLYVCTVAGTAGNATWGALL